MVSTLASPALCPPATRVTTQGRVTAISTLALATTSSGWEQGVLDTSDLSRQSWATRWEAGSTLTCPLVEVLEEVEATPASPLVVAAAPTSSTRATPS